VKRACLLSILLLWCGANLRAAYRFNVSPGSLNFGNVIAGNTLAQTFTITNTSTDASNTPISFTAAVSGTGFSVGPISPSSVPPGSTATFTVTFAPASTTGYTGTLTVRGTTGNAQADPSPQTINLSGAGIGPFAVSPTSLSFGNILLGCSVSQNFTIQPGEPLSFTLSTTPVNGPFSVNPSSLTNTGGPTTVAATFTPTAAGSVSGGAVTVVASNGQNQQIASQSVPLTATAVDVAPSPATLDFGPVPVGSTSAPKTVTLNTNPAGVTGYQFSAKSSSPAFAVSPVSSSGAAQVTFTPSAQGTASGTITFTITDPARATCPLTRTVQVTGAGGTATVTLNPTSLDFGSVTTGTTSAPKSVVLTNNSATPFTGTVSSSNPLFAVSPASFPLSGSASQTFNVAFAPSATGAQTGTITFNLTSGAGAGAVTTSVALTATGQGQAPASLSVSPALIDFGNVATGSSANSTVVVSNTGGTAANVTGSTASPFSLSTSSFTVAARGTQNVTVTFTPASAGPFQGTATFTSGGSTQSVTLKGTGLPPPTATLAYSFGSGQGNTPIPAGGTIRFPDTAPGSPSGAIQFQITNSGTAPATISSITSSSAAFAVTAPSLPVTVPPGGNIGLSIVFTPASPGPATATLSINGQTFNLTGNGASASAVTITGTGAASPAQQPTVGVTLAEAYSVAASGQLTLTFSPNAAGAPDDPSIQFVSGGRSAAFTVPANSRTATFAGGATQIALQTGTVAGTITLSATLTASGVNVTPSPAPTGVLTIPPSAPVIQMVTASKSGNTITVVVIAFATSREVTRAAIQLNAASGANLQTTSLSADVGSLFTSWFNSAASSTFGGMFKLTIPLTVTGDPNAIASVSVALSNANGTSPSVQSTP